MMRSPSQSRTPYMHTNRRSTRCAEKSYVRATTSFTHHAVPRTIIRTRHNTSTLPCTITLILQGTISGEYSSRIVQHTMVVQKSPSLHGVPTGMNCPSEQSSDVPATNMFTRCQHIRHTIAICVITSHVSHSCATQYTCIRTGFEFNTSQQL
jgi:hypothetical protein